jgi:hypothetical protein
MGWWRDFIPNIPRDWEMVRESDLHAHLHWTPNSRGTLFGSTFMLSSGRCSGKWHLLTSGSSFRLGILQELQEMDRLEMILQVLSRHKPFTTPLAFKRLVLQVNIPRLISIFPSGRGHAIVLRAGNTKMTSAPSMRVCVISLAVEVCSCQRVVDSIVERGWTRPRSHCVDLLLKIQPGPVFRSVRSFDCQ